MAYARLILFLVCLSALAKDKAPIFSIQQDIARFKAHSSIKLGEQEIILLKNNNSLCSGDREFFAGKLILKKEYMNSFHKKAELIKTEDSGSRQELGHKRKFLAHGKRVQADSLKDFQDLMNYACETDKWTPLDAIFLTRDKNILSVKKVQANKKNESFKINMPKECPKEEGFYTCSLERYGKFYFLAE